MKLFALPEPLTVYGSVVDQLGVGEYDSGNHLAVVLYSQLEDMPEAHEPFTTLSVNLPDQANLLEKGQFFMKNYSENEAISKAMLKAGYVEVVRANVGKCGYAGTVPICRLAEKALTRPIGGWPGTF